MFTQHWATHVWEEEGEDEKVVQTCDTQKNQNWKLFEAIAATSVTRLGDFLKKIGDKSNPNDG